MYPVVNVDPGQVSAVGLLGVPLCGVSSGGGPGRGRTGPRRFALVSFALVVGPETGAERSEAKADRNMARSSLLLPPW